MVDIINEDEVDSYVAIDCEEKDTIIIIEENVKGEPPPLRRSTRVRRPVEIYQAGSSLYRCHIMLTQEYCTKKSTLFLVNT